MTALPQKLKRFHKRSLFAADESPYGVSIICYQYAKRMFKEANTVEEVEALLDAEESGQYSIGFFILPDGRIMGSSNFKKAWDRLIETGTYSFTLAEFVKDND